MISVIIPIYNEEEILLSNVSRLSDAVRSLPEEYEILIAEDGSTDDSRLLANRLVSKSIRLINSPERLGRGLSLAHAIRQSRGSIVIYMDADLSTDLGMLGPVVEEIAKGADICTGSRLLADSKVIGRNSLRESLSRLYNLFLRLLFKTSVKDHQCGFKAFNRDKVLPLLDDVSDRHWFWDTELLIKAQDRGLRVTEVPVTWEDRKKSSVEPLVDVPYMLISMLKLRFTI